MADLCITNYKLYVYKYLVLHLFNLFMRGLNFKFDYDFKWDLLDLLELDYE